MAASPEKKRTPPSPRPNEGQFFRMPGCPQSHDASGHRDHLAGNDLLVYRRRFESLGRALDNQAGKQTVPYSRSNPVGPEGPSGTDHRRIGGVHPDPSPGDLSYLRRAAGVVGMTVGDEDVGHFMSTPAEGSESFGQKRRAPGKTGIHKGETLG